MDDTPDTLPSREEQRFLLEQVAALVAATGPDPLVVAPLVEPTPISFPGRWTADLASATAIVRVLMRRAGLDALEVDLVAFADGEHPEGHILGWFTGIHEGTCRFGVHVAQLADAESFAGVMAHEVAHAFRARHGLARDDRELEERLTDLTTVYLGFGVLTTSLTELRRRHQNYWRVVVTTSRGGYLTTEEMAFLLALQAVVRRADDADVARIGKLVGSGPAKCFRDSFGELYARTHKLAARLGVAAVTPGRTFDGGSFTLTEGVGWPFGRVAFRVVQRWLGAGVFGGLVVGAAVAALLPPGFATVAWLVAISAGAELGARARVETCSRCEAPLALRGPDHCPGCAALLVAEMHYPPAKFGAGENAGKRVFRVRGSRAVPLTLLGTALGFIAGFALIPYGPAWAGLAVAVGAVAGFVHGKTRRLDTCSGGSCDAPLEHFLWQCPRCLGEIVGEIRKKSDRLEADEAAARRDARAAKTRPPA